MGLAVDDDDGGGDGDDEDDADDCVDCAAGSADGRNSIRRSTSCVAPSRSLVESIRYHDSTTTSVDIEDPTAKRPTSSGTERSFSTERRVRRVGMNAMDSSNDLLDFLADEDSSVGSGEFVRTGSLRGRRRHSAAAAGGCRQRQSREDDLALDDAGQRRRPAAAVTQPRRTGAVVVARTRTAEGNAEPSRVRVGALGG